MTRPRLEPRSPGPLANTLTIILMGRSLCYLYSESSHGCKAPCSKSSAFGDQFIWVAPLFILRMGSSILENERPKCLSLKRDLLLQRLVSRYFIFCLRLYFLLFFISACLMASTSNIIISLICEVFTQALADSFPQESEW